VSTILADFSMDVSKAVFVTDRGANVLAAMNDWKHISCSDHMLNTVLTTLFDNLDECPKIKALLSASKELVWYFKKSGLMQHLKSALKQEVSTRWNTMFYLLESVLSNFDEIHHILTARGEGYRMAALYKASLEVIVPFPEFIKQRHWSSRQQQSRHCTCRCRGFTSCSSTAHLTTPVMAKCRHCSVQHPIR